MLTCGMYDSAGDWVSTVGIPAKSGISGGIITREPTSSGLPMKSSRSSGPFSTIIPPISCPSVNGQGSGLGQ